MSEHHDRNSAKHEYEVERGTMGTVMVFVGNREQTAIAGAVAILSGHPDEKSVRLYHSYPSPGPLRRYVGTVDRDGNLRRPA